MYPDRPKSAADLVPLPLCDGPKLGPFMFQGPQRIEFLEYLGQGSHSHVFKVRIQEKVYALKLFRFVYDYHWKSSYMTPQSENLQTLSTLANYAEPFNCECRAYGRLQEAGYEDLSVRCFGYLLLDEEHERIMMNQFSHLKHVDLDFTGDMDDPGCEELRSRFPGKDGRPPPIRGIVKELGQSGQDLTTPLARKILRDVIKLQQLGIIDMDVAHRQIINGKLSDFSTAVTVPHFVTSPELNPNLNSKQISAMEFETFQLSSHDYCSFDFMVREWNKENNGKIKVYAFPGVRGCQAKYNLRSKSPGSFYTFVDPRKLGEGVSKKREWARWYYDCDGWRAAELRIGYGITQIHAWEVRDGYIFPRTPTG
ncbi:kinetochore Sim4 complex subunit FTA2-domain-containing protein [Xylariaceae sp. FL0662B]|nr:kinetochore Sim4 complex subunit FTA2-domain-containing protein [Xylariaceae sp. FL0662B]